MTRAPGRLHTDGTGDDVIVQRDVRAMLTALLERSREYVTVHPPASGAAISPAALSSDQTDYSPTGWSGATFVRLNPTAPVGIYSFDANVTVKFKWLFHVGGDFDITIFNDSYVTPVAANRVQAAKPNNLYLLRSFVQPIWYDDISSRWRPA